MYILFEGVDTSGKSTQIDLFATRKPNVLTTKEPGGTDLGVRLREILLQSDAKISFNAELLLFLADRAEHYAKVIANNSDKLIISDRGFISGISYAKLNHPKLSLDFLLRINKFALNDSLPEKIVLFETNATLIKQRLGTKTQDKIEQRGIEYLLAVQSMMLETIKILQLPYMCVDAAWSVEKIYKKIEEFIDD
ncbi:MAG: dTMP kinase [Sulfurospirillum sp.]|nr:dTMP kinase [Sulfurospirillum sp.]